MPEGPEAHTIARKIDERVRGKHILSVEILDTSRPVCKQSYTPTKSSIHYMPTPNKIQSVVAHGKRPIFILERGYMVVFLAMTGRFRFERETHSAIKIEIGDYEVNGPFILQDTTHTLYYNGCGPCGNIYYIPDAQSLSLYFSDIGPDMLSSPPSIEIYREILRRAITEKDWQICAFLLEQKYVSGVGNYLRSDIMYLCKLRPDRRLSSLTNEDINRLYATTISIMRLSYQHGGLTRKDYWDPDGNKGTYPRLVYDNPKDPYGNLVHNDKFEDGRNVYWVPGIQI